MVQWLRLSVSNVGDIGSIPGLGTKIPRALARPKDKRSQCSIIPFIEQWVRIRCHLKRFVCIACLILPTALWRRYSSFLYYRQRNTGWEFVICPRSPIIEVATEIQVCLAPKFSLLTAMGSHVSLRFFLTQVSEHIVVSSGNPERHSRASIAVM